MGDVAGLGAELPLLSYITHEMLTAAGAGVLYSACAFKQAAMGIPPNHTAAVRAEAALPMPGAEHETHTALVADATFNWDSFYFKRFWMQIAQAKGFHCIT